MKKRPDEFSLIKRYFAPLADEGSFGLQDDAALITPTTGKSLVITQDAIAEGVHFLPNDPPDLIARKALRVNLSDLASKGAVPKYFSLALGLSDSWEEAWVASFASGLEQDIAEFDIKLTGGDTFASGGGIVISITAIGESAPNEYVSRLGGSVGDALYVTGTIGDAVAGLMVRRRELPDVCIEDASYLEERYLIPQPRCEMTGIVREFASAAMDISDGLIADLGKLCTASGVSASILVDAIPRSNALERLIRRESDFQKIAVTGGDDYEILFAVPANKLSGFETVIAQSDVKITRIGTLDNAGAGVTVLDPDGKQVNFAKSGYTHFGENH